MRCEGQIRLWLLSEKKKKKKDHLYLCCSFRCGCIHYHYSKPQYHQCLVFPSQIQSPAASLTLSFWSLSRELNQANKQKSREQFKMFCISESEADPAVGCLFTAVRDDLCGFFFPFIYLLMIMCPLCFCISYGELLYHYHLCTLEKYLVSFPISSAAKPVSKEILNSSARTAVDVPQ